MSRLSSARSGVAASTIHKVEARQMVPTVSVLLKIAKGLGRRPEELIRDRFDEPPLGPAGDCRHESTAAASLAQGAETPIVAVWPIRLSANEALPPIDLDPQQRAIVLVEDGEIALEVADRKVRMKAGDCIEVRGGRLRSHPESSDAAGLKLIVSPPGDLATRLGTPCSSSPRFS